MPEGDTIHRSANVLRNALLGKRVIAAQARPGGARLDLVVGSRVDVVRSRGKHLLIGFDVGLTLHTHLGMKGSWHRYGPDERWRRHPDAAVAVLRVERDVAVCFDAPVVELVETRALTSHPVLARLGPDLLAQDPDLGSAVDRLLAPERAGVTIAEALLDQTAVAGIGNVYRSEILFLAGQDPFQRMDTLSADLVTSLVSSAVTLLRANTRGGPRSTVPAASSHSRASGDRLWVYRRVGRPCRRCGTLIRSESLGSPPRPLFWCSSCQATASTIRTSNRWGR